jgi:kynureninase
MFLPFEKVFLIVLFSFFLCSRFLIAQRSKRFDKSMAFENTLEFAKSCDKNDSLNHFRSQFYIPKKNNQEIIYFCGNSLGLEPKSTKQYIEQELNDWASFAVEGHFDAKHPWYHYKEFLKESVARLLGAKSEEVVVMNSLTVNLHLLLVSFYRPSSSRYKIICEYDAFPSDIYAVQSQAKFHGYNSDDAVIMLKPRLGEYCLRTEDVIKAIKDCGDSLATVMLGAVNFYTGQFFELNKITEAAQQVGASCGFNLAHAAGNIPMQLHDWNVDYACFCSYKYLNGGPGSVSGIFVHQNHLKNQDLPRFAGWWGNDPATRFEMAKKFTPHPSASAWALSNDPVLSMAALKASLDIFDEAGIENLRTKSEALTGYLEFVIGQINFNLQTPKIKLEIITPKEKENRGCQLSIIAHGLGKDLYRKLSSANVVCDWREPNVIRVAPTPLYNTFKEVYRFGQILEKALQKDE